MNRPLSFHPLALSQWERVCFYADGVLGFRPGSGNERLDVIEDLPRVRKLSLPRGHVKAIAEKFIAGGYGSLTANDVAAEERLDSESFKQRIWQLRNNWKSSPRKKGRAA